MSYKCIPIKEVKNINVSEEKDIVKLFFATLGLKKERHVELYVVNIGKADFVDGSDFPTDIRTRIDDQISFGAFYKLYKKHRSLTAIISIDEYDVSKISVTYTANPTLSKITNAPLNKLVCHVFDNTKTEEIDRVFSEISTVIVANNLSGKYKSL